MVSDDEVNQTDRQTTRAQIHAQQDADLACLPAPQPAPQPSQPPQLLRSGRNTHPPDRLNYYSRQSVANLSLIYTNLR